MSEEMKENVEVIDPAVDNGISKSKAKRQARAAEAKAAKAKKNFDAILGWVIGIALAIVVIAVIGAGIYTEATKTKSSSDFSAGLTEDGFVKGGDMNAVKDLGIEGMEIPYAAVEYIDDKVESDLLSAASQYASYQEDPTLTVENGNSINLDYSGSIDGVAFDGGTADHQSLVIGSGSFIDNFEEQLIGSHPGDDVTVNVTFPETYESNPDLAGKAAVFECHINSIYVTPEVDDEFVQTYYSDLASTADEFRAYIKDQGYQSNLDSYLANYITENASVSKIPSSYKKLLRSLIKYSDEETFEQYKTYMSYYGYDSSSMTFS
ncbi:MAG: FKBP-type peptidyl-prolyl cis-trans isomerase, partial [Lachnospiraceae bacterium]|nr:FKBP-type peptidyl-prolyl cis-trans isomerase [Lachnospiraceae bacterium]